MKYKGITGAVSPQVMKHQAVKIMNELGIAKPYIMYFEANDQVYLFYDGEAIKIDPNNPLYERIREIEQKHHVKIYAVTLEYLGGFMEMHSFLCVSRYPEDWKYQLRRMLFGKHLAYAYVENVDIPQYSEFGSVVLTVENGILKREE